MTFHYTGREQVSAGVVPIDSTAAGKVERVVRVPWQFTLLLLQTVLTKGMLQ